MIARLSMTVLFLASVGLAGCGKLGELDQPPPLFGAQAKADYAAQKHAEDAARARASAARAPAPEDDNAQDPGALPLTQAPFAPPIAGRSDPEGDAGPPTALPTPGQPAAGQ
jgi:hypothetical protein